MKISFFSKVFEKKAESTIEFLDYIQGIKVGRWEDVVLNYRAGRTKKELIPCVTPSGTFNERKLAGLLEHSGVINIDIDAKDNNDIDLLQLRAELYADNFIYAGHCSVSGLGLSLYIKINPKKHYESFCAIEKYLANKYSILVDKQCKDVSRLRFVSYDPDTHINEKAKKWVEYIEKVKQEPKVFSDYITSKDDFGHTLRQITDRRINIADDYADWLKIGFAIANEYGEIGRSYFHSISSCSAKYDYAACDRKYNSILKTGSNSIKINTFFFLAKQAGCEIKSPRTQRIESVGKMRYKQIGKSGGFQSKDEAKREAKKYLHDVEKIEGDDVDQILDQIEELPEQSLNEKSDVQTRIDRIMQVAKVKKIQFNRVTQKLEIEGRELNDNDLNSGYLDLVEIDEKITNDFFKTVVYSNRIDNFDPFLDFIEKHKHLKPSGKISEVLECLKDEMFYNNDKISDYKDVYVRKWMLSIMASIHGTYSLMILVLTGRQMIQKTNFFREFLPPELRKYYAESKLDAGKDDEVLMCEKLIIVDDEFGGKSKQEAKKLKDLSSKQYFSIRKAYGRVTSDLRRIAVLGGTSNDDEILNDPTGNRRIIPLKVTDIDIDKYRKIDKTELFMELYHEWRKIGDNWMLTPGEVKILNESTVKHEQDIVEYDLIQKYSFEDNMFIDEITTTDIKVFLEERTGQRLNINKIGQSLNKLGYYKKPLRKGSNTKQIWNLRLVSNT